MVAPASRPVVIADDDADDLFFARRALKRAGVQNHILTCADGAEVIALLERIAAANQALPRVIFLDVKMPRLGGFETLKWIRSQRAFQAVPVVMLSGSKEARDVALAQTLGAIDYLVKYPDAAEFTRVLTVADGAAAVGNESGVG